MDLLSAIRRQAQACAELGSPMYADLLTRVAEDVADSAGVSARVLAGHEDDPGPSALALRLLGSVHRLVLEQRAPALAAFYPSAGGEWDPCPGWRAFRRVLGDRAAEVRARLDRSPQTNEVGRSAALMGGLLHVVHRTGLPIRLREIGSSGGLNLRADHFCYTDDTGAGYGREDSPVRLVGAWDGVRLPFAPVQVVDRVGSDVAPVDVSTEDGRLTLMAYVWPDQTERFARLQNALQVADEVPAEVLEVGAREFVDGLDLVDGTTTVLWHSVMWQYLTSADREAVAERITALGAQATPDRGFAHLQLEPTRRTPESEHEFLVVLRMWPDGGRRVLGTAAPHGLPTTWE